MLKQVHISVLMAVYNTDFAATKRAIDSVLNQDYSDFELIIIDDGSTKNNRESLIEYIVSHEDRVSYIRHSNRGQAASINRGVLNSVGTYITILDSDDEYKPNHLSSCLREMEFTDLICSTSEIIVLQCGASVDIVYACDVASKDQVAIWSQLWVIFTHKLSERSCCSFTCEQVLFGLFR